MSSFSIGPFVGLGFDLLFYIIFYKWYKNINRQADEIKAAPYIKLEDKLLDKLSKSDVPYIKYACVEGEVLPVSQVLPSRHAEGKVGVVQQISVTEHRAKRDQGVWYNVKNTVQDKIQSVPFKLRRWLGRESQTEIVVNDATSASFLMDDLTVTHDLFEPTESKNAISRGIDRLFGEVPKGVHYNEKMLLSNTLLLGIGEIALLDGKLHLNPPRDGQMYVLTTKSRAEVIKMLSKRSNVAKVFVITTAVIGSTILGYILYKYIKQWQRSRSDERVLDEFRELRRQADRADDNGETDNSCVICLTNRREIVLLDCGHICLCADCVVVLPEPLTCPVCRSQVVRYITTYNP
ncbi:negative regulation of chemokine (C-C motif) ligand 5 production [Mactra antiquata]